MISDLPVNVQLLTVAHLLLNNLSASLGLTHLWSVSVVVQTLYWSGDHSQHRSDTDNVVSVALV